MITAILVVLGFGVALIIVGLIKRGQNTRCTARARGTLREYRPAKRDRKAGYLYAYSVDGVEYVLRTTEPSPQAYSVGDTCDIWYNPAKPKDSLACRRETNRLYNNMILIGSIMVLAVVTFFVWALTLVV